MKKRVVGIDPGSVKSGFAVYEDSKLVKLMHLDFIEAVDFMKDNGWCVYVIEDVKVNGFLYGRNKKKDISVSLKIAQDVRMVKQVQTHLELFINDAYADLIRVKPQRGNWADPKNKAIFERFTGWRGRSSRDARSAAYFGFLYI